MDNRAGGVRIQVQGDARLLAGVTGALESFARRVEMSDAARIDLVEATAQAGRDTFPLLTAEHPALDVYIDVFDDRIEVALEHRGEALPSAGLDTFLESGDDTQAAGLQLMTRVDRVLYSTEKGTSRTTLVKYLKK